MSKKNEPTVVTHSLLKQFRRCPQAAMYHYVDRLTPKQLGKPLQRGTWVHELLEAYYKGEDWKRVHKENTSRYSKLFDEEKEALGNLPLECLTLFEGYLWHYKKDKDWKVHEVEFKLEATLPGGALWQGKSDMLIEDDYGLWVVDHKTHNQLPDTLDRMLDQQSVLYLWACRENDIPVTGFIWNYIKATGPKAVKINKNGDLSKVQGESVHPYAKASVVEQGYSPADERYAGHLAMLKAQRYSGPDQPQTSPLYQRHRLEKSDTMIASAVREAAHTAERYVNYDWQDRVAVERVAEKSCHWCSYKDICVTELVGGNIDNLKRQQFEVADPFAYYQGREEKKNG